MRAVGQGRPHLQGCLDARRIAQNDVEQALREADVELAKAKCIFLEADGKITVLEKKD